MEHSRKYLENVVEVLWSRHGSAIAEVNIILPTRRSRLFLVDALRRKAGKSFWTPKFYTASDFFSEVSGCELIPPLRQLLILYELYKDCTDTPDSFGDFVKWAPLALNDFSDVESSLADSKKVFSDLRNIREIENWSFNEENLSEGQKNFLVFWETLGKLHATFRQWQRTNKCFTYAGLVRFLSEDPESTILWNGKPTYWIAPSGLSAAEEKLIKISRAHEPIELIPDIDSYYASDENHEASKVFRSIQFDHKWLTNRLSESTRTINVFECSTSYTQTVQTALILAGKTPDELRDTAVIIADDQLLEQMMSGLNNLPVSLNIAMGIPVFRTPAGRWIQSLLKCYTALHLNRAAIHYKWFAQYLNYSVESGMGDNDCQMLLKKLISKNWNFISVSDLHSYTLEYPSLEGLLKLISAPDVSFLLSNTISLLSSAKPLSEWAAVSVVKLRQILEDLNNDILQYPVLTEDTSLSEFLFMLMQRERIHFEGEPVDGLQILTLSETQGIDFKNVIIAGASEDYLPGKNFDQTLLPSDLRAHYGMPVPSDREALPSYLFWRLMQGASEVNILFPTVSADFRVSEQSRYITQIFTEFPKTGYRKMNHQTVSAPAMSSSSGEVIFDDFCRERVLLMFEKGISPSAINKFNACPLDFYYRYILGLGEQEELEEQMSSASFGLIIHRVLEDFYKPFKGHAPSLKDFQGLSDNIEKYVTEAAERSFHTSSVKYGYNRLAIEMAGRILSKYIALEMAAIDENWQITALETQLWREVIIDPPLPFSLKVRGTADRIDARRGVHRILDYKTGKVKESDYIIRSRRQLEEIIPDKNNAKLIQLLLYRYMYAQFGDAAEVTAGFYSFSGTQLGYKMIAAESDDFFVDFDVRMSMALANWAVDVLSSEVLRHNSDSQYCLYCRS